MQYNKNTQNTQDTQINLRTMK